MYLSELSLRDFRSWPQLSLGLQPGVTLFVGRNGFGKTNIVEAVGYLAHLSSHRVSQDAPLVRVGAGSARVSATAINQGRELTAHVLIKPHAANQAQINRTRLKSPREILGVVRTVLFAPEDLALVRGEPAERRRYMDAIIATRSPRLAGVKADYDKVLKQRNALLKSAQHALRRGYSSEEGAAALGTLDAWDGHLAYLGSQLIVARQELVRRLNVEVHEAYASLAPESRPAALRYRCSVSLPASTKRTNHIEHAEHSESSEHGVQMTQASGCPERETSGTPEESGTTGTGDTHPPLASAVPRLGPPHAVNAGQKQGSPDGNRREVIEAAMLAELGAKRQREIERGMSLVGPHRDDLELLLGQQPAKGFASHGETWSFAIALRFGEFSLLRSEGSDPILILDDVFAELDAKRRIKLVDLATQAEQVLITAAVDEDLPENLSRKVVASHRIEVRAAGKEESNHQAPQRYSVLAPSSPEAPDHAKLITDLAQKPADTGGTTSSEGADATQGAEHA